MSAIGAGMGDADTRQKDGQTHETLHQTARCRNAAGMAKDLDFLLGADVAEEIALRSYDHAQAMRLIVMFARERELDLKQSSEAPPDGHTRDGLYGMGMATEFMADVIEGVLRRMP